MDALNTTPALQRIITEDAIGQLRRRDGRMAELGSENGELKLDWVEGVARLLADPAMLEEVEAEARDLWQRGIRHIIWAGMGGSVLTVRVLTSLGFCSASSSQAAQPASSEQITIYPLDSTDPAALNAIVQQIAGAKNLRERVESQGNQEEGGSQRSNDAAKNQGGGKPRPYPVTEQLDVENQGGGKPHPYPMTGLSDEAFLRSLLGDVLMIGVSMGMTSEEPITHLAWFADLLDRAQLPQAEHLMVMTLPGSYLDQFAQERSAASLPLQPDRGTGTGGRMSAPATRVFLLPAALAFAHIPSSPGGLRAILRRAWELYNLELASAQPAEHAFVKLAAAMSDASLDGVCLLLVAMPPGWDALVPWLEQLMEESLGKGGKGVVVFKDQTVHVHAEKDEGDQQQQAAHTAEKDEGDQQQQAAHTAEKDEGAGQQQTALTTQKDEGARKGPHPSQPHPRPYNDYEGGSSAPVHSKGGGGVDAGWGPLRAPSSQNVHVFNDRGPLRAPSSLIVHVTTTKEVAGTEDTQQGKPEFVLSQPYLAATDDGERLAGLAASFMDWQLSMALFGYLHDITFAGQPAVENYKARARVLRMQENPLSGLEHWGAQCSDGILTLYGPQEAFSQVQNDITTGGMANTLARALREAYTTQRLTYLDGTINGEASAAFLGMFGQHLRRIGNDLFGVPVKLRRAPADYHSTEQSEMDGPPSLVSLRLLARQHEQCLVGSYDDTFLCAQAVSTWQAMLEQGRSCFLLVVDSTFEDGIESLRRFFERVITMLETS